MPVISAHATSAYHWYATLAAWGDIGSLLAGLSAVGLAIIAVFTGTAGLNDWRARQRAEVNLLNEQAREIELDRMRLMNGWTPGMVNSFGVRLVTDPGEMSQAQGELMANGDSKYALLAINEDTRHPEQRGQSLRELVDQQGHVARAPTHGEYDAILRGLTLQHLGGQWQAPGRSDEQDRKMGRFRRRKASSS